MIRFKFGNDLTYRKSLGFVPNKGKETLLPHKFSGSNKCVVTGGGSVAFLSWKRSLDRSENL